MKTDSVRWGAPLECPPERGRGSGRDAWVIFALQLGHAHCNLVDAAEAQFEVIRDLEAEVTLLRRQIASRRPKGARPPIDAARVTTIEAELAAGVYSQRAIAARVGVSPMTVTRIAVRVRAREGA